ncbi:lipid II flippase Amj family protein [Paenibacillus glycanilyticus]|uniref:lipid II flippase Amj family protein n=1 Tax=Paenibacillus glycanilyticus TaxID=126569 RepID=UPI002040677A|nr:lipid II flippase Amj family protein [Paenibacillus glycanilyticus]MCM3626780.1 lipid II flippase Amj family protein [Paenibacillus glycanilyticus]
MFQQILLVSICTFIVHFSETLTYSLRLAGVRLGKLAVAISLTGIILLISRTANMLQAPLTGKIVDVSKDSPGDLVMQFRMIISAASLGTLAAILLFPSAVFLSKRIIAHLEVTGSLPQLLIQSVSIRKLKNARFHLRVPKKDMLSRLRIGGIPKRLFLLNIIVTAIYTVGVLAALLAATYSTGSSIAASQSSGLINGMATILLTILIDPQIGLLTDKVLKGEKEIAALNKVFGLLMISRLLGTILAQLLLVPSAHWINLMVQYI